MCEEVRNTEDLRKSQDYNSEIERIIRGAGHEPLNLEEMKRVAGLQGIASEVSSLKQKLLEAESSRGTVTKMSDFAKRASMASCLAWPIC
jgi:hypothetical protein